MRAVTFGTFLSSLLCAAIVWCFLVLRVVAGHNHFHLSAHDFGVSFSESTSSISSLLCGLIGRYAPQREAMVVASVGL